MCDIIIFPRQVQVLGEARLLHLWVISLLSALREVARHNDVIAVGTYLLPPLIVSRVFIAILLLILYCCQSSFCLCVRVLVVLYVKLR